MFSRITPILTVCIFIFMLTIPLAADTGSAAVTHSTFFGGALQECNYDEAFDRLSCATTMDAVGNFYLAGESDSFDLPLLNNIYGPCGLDADADTTACEAQQEANTAFIAKFNADLEPQFITYFPTSDVRDIAVDAQGNIYFVGSAGGAPRSVDVPDGFPVTADAYQSDCSKDEFDINCTPDGYLAKLSADGQQLLYATYLGGGADDQMLGVAVHGDLVAVGGSTNSDDFPTTAGVLRPTVGEQGMGFVSVFNFETTPTLNYSTYLGDTGIDSVQAVAFDSAGRVIAAGKTFSTNFPVQNPIEECDTDLNNFCWDGFVLKLTADGSSLVYGSYLSGGNVEVRDMVVDGQDRVYVVGNSHRNSWGFLTRMNSDGSAWDYTTDFGETREYATGVAVDDNGIAYVTGMQTEADMEGYDVFAATVSNRGQIIDELVVGGTGDDLPSGVVLNVSQQQGSLVTGLAYVIGFTLSQDFPLHNAGNSAYYQAAPDGPTNADGTFEGDAFITNLSGLSVQESVYIYLPLVLR
jgi:hypothetical protein